MPLFGSSHKNDNKLEKHNRAAEAHGHGYATAQSANIDDTLNQVGGVGVGPGAGGASGPGVAGVGSGHGHGHHNAGMQQPGMQPGMNDPMMQQQQPGMGAGMGGGMGAGNAAGIPPSGTLAGNQQHGGGGAMTGKIEQKVGALVGSNALKAKGMQKEQEAHAIKVQSQELAEAERLEREAGLRRERAVAHGAHPDNRHVGGMGGATGGGVGGGQGF
ncbi:hypothetical protein B0H16DRAFT_1697193 [Mycena metata]|uniref:Uncharacterized protein n=1 Tax=Mycena metata TaxID=1033252 RepID=A0AAD7HXF1_9AGAR|nr:hypothetical protein B0H16DRAFT_1697193 [Mycena metata]